MNDQSPSAYRVMQVISLARATLDSLRDDHGQVIDDDDELLAALASEGVSVETLLSAMGRAVLDAEADVEAANARITALCARRDRHARRHQALRDTLLAAMQAIGLKKHVDCEFSASWRPGKPKMIVTDVDALPREMVVKRETLVPDRDMIRTALDAGDYVSGATYGNAGPILTMRTK